MEKTTWRVPMSMYIDLDLAKRLKEEKNQSEVLRVALREFYARRDSSAPAESREEGSDANPSSV